MAERVDTRDRTGKRAAPDSRDAWISVADRHDYDPAKVAEYLGWTRAAVHRQVQRFGVRFYPRFRYRTKETWNLIFAKHKTLREAAESMGMSTSGLSHALKKLGVEHGYRRHSIEGSRINSIDTETLVALIEKHGKRPLARMLGINRSMIYRELGRRGLR